MYAVELGTIAMWFPVYPASCMAFVLLMKYVEVGTYLLVISLAIA